MAMSSSGPNSRSFAGLHPDDLRHQRTMFDGGFLFQAINIRKLEKRHQQMILRGEREKQLIGRYHSISIAETLEVQNVRSLIFASWFIYLKYQMVNHRMLNINNIDRAYEDHSWARMDKNLFLFCANII